MITCPSCGQENPDGFRLCGMCGASLAPEMVAREERKIVTVVFCDLVGFTAKAEQLDPEDVRAILGPYHERVRSELERHGGTVEKFIGDAVMALFGAPTAHEDDPERAVRAALAIRDFAVDERLELRVGVTTGEALVSLGASPSEGEGMASGDVVNTAARLQSAAPVNGILVDETTFRATRQNIDYGEAPDVEAKGKAEPVPVWEALAARSRFGIDVTHHARAELVGRERELSVLRDAFERARHERIPQLITLVAVPGMGKSRLVYELSKIVDADPELVTWRQGRCLAYGDGVAFWALAEVVKAQAGILERDTEQETAEKLRSAVDDAFVDETDARFIESHLRPLVGLESDTGLGGDRRGEAFAAWRRFLEALAEQRPLVLVLEDLHWADEGLLDFVDELVDWLSGVPLLVVCSARPELLERRPGWGGGKLNASTLGLSPLSSEQTALLISHVLERSLLPAEIQKTLLERAEGNPLYAEQFAQLYLERGSAEDLPLPETLQGIVAARLDGLSGEEKAALQDASVFGKVFWTGALGRSGEATALLHSLERKGFLTRQRRTSVEGEDEWAFAHMLLRDVAYGQIPRAERAHKHRAAAEWVESLGRSEDHAEVLAFHWSSALELAQASGQPIGELDDRSRLALREAGDRAFALNSFSAAEKYYEEALELWPESDRDRPELLFRRAHALYLVGDERRGKALLEARDMLLAAGDTERAAEAEAFLASVAWYRGQFDKVKPHLDRAAELAGGTPSGARARVLSMSARLRTVSGEAEAGMRIAEEALEMAGALGLDELRAHALATIGTAKSYALDDPTGVPDLERALEIALEIDSPIAGAIVNNLAACIPVGDGGLLRAEELYAESRRLAERFGDGLGLRFFRGASVWLDWVRGRWDDALESANKFVAECEAGSPHVLETYVHLNRASIRLGRGDIDGALADHARALTLARGAKDPEMLAAVLAVSAGNYAEVEKWDDARTLVDELIPVIQAHPDATSWESVAAPYAERLGVREELREIVETARSNGWNEASLLALDLDFLGAAEIFASMPSPTLEAWQRRSAGKHLIQAGRRAEGNVELEKALVFYRSVGATFYVDRCQALLREAKTA